METATHNEYHALHDVESWHFPIVYAAHRPVVGARPQHLLIHTRFFETRERCAGHSRQVSRQQN